MENGGDGEEWGGYMKGYDWKGSDQKGCDDKIGDRKGVR